MKYKKINTLSGFTESTYCLNPVEPNINTNIWSDGPFKVLA
jgi:hypothetical protein